MVSKKKTEAIAVRYEGRATPYPVRFGASQHRAVKKAFKLSTCDSLSGWVREISARTAPGEGPEWDRIQAAAQACDIADAVWIREVCLAAANESALAEHLRRARAASKRLAA